MMDAPSDRRDRYRFRLPVNARLPWQKSRVSAVIPKIVFWVGKKEAQLSRVRNHSLGCPVEPEVSTAIQARSGISSFIKDSETAFISEGTMTGTRDVPLSARNCTSWSCTEAALIHATESPDESGARERMRQAFPGRGADG